MVAHMHKHVRPPESTRMTELMIRHAAGEVTVLARGWPAVAMVGAIAAMILTVILLS
jgi:hypothetical protein